MADLNLRFSVLLVGMLAMLPPPSEAGSRTNTRVRPCGVLADSLFRAAMADTTRPVKERITLLKQVLKVDRNHTEALHALGCLYMAQNTIFSRDLARRRLERVLQLDSENVRYHESYATLLRRQGFYYNSMRHFKKILEMDADHADAACEVGEYLLRDMLKYVDARRFDGGGSMRSFGLESRDEAADFFQYALRKDPYCRRAYYRLGFLSLESGRPKGLVRLSKLLLERYPGDPDGLLFLGLGYQEMGDMERADRAYREALDWMGERDRRVMESPELIGLIAGREERLGLGLSNGRDARGEAVFTPGLARFWKVRDPLFLTRFNERRMAHYGRVAYANLRFSRPDEGVVGRETDMGKVWIRYGRYLGRERTIEPYREVWAYEDFRIVFYSYDSFHWWIEFSKDDQWVTGRYGRGDVLSSGFARRERYVDPYADQKYRLPTQVGVFKAPDNRVKVDLSWALPKVRLGYLKLYDTYQVNLQDGVFLFDDADDPVVRQVRRREVFRDVWQDTLKSCYLLDRASVTLEGGAFRLAVEVRDKEKETIGTFRDTLNVEPFGEVRLGLSSIILATQVIGGEDGGGRGRLQVIPNPVRTYTRSEPLYLYFEVYNLAQDAFGQTRYRVEYRIGMPKLRRLPLRLDRAARARLGLEGERWTVSVATDYTGGRSDESLHLDVALSDLKPGLQLLTLVVTDQNTGLRAGREALFRIVK